MPSYPMERHVPIIDLTVPPGLKKPVEKLLKCPVMGDDRKAIEALTAEESPRRRMPVLSEAFRNYETREMVQLLRTAGKMSLEHDPVGLRLLFSFLEVKRPGVEVLRQLSTLASLERVSLKVLLGTWRDADAGVTDAAFPILELMREAGRSGVLDLGGDALPKDP
ncbi:MAG TPA: hypothetical protein VF720_13670, partial [Candidatus Eisenbacteria bacterium]